jgi:hypothetical protein
VSRGLDAATRALASIDGFSDDEREVIVGLLKMGRAGMRPGYEGRSPSLIGLIDRAFAWSAFDHWHAFFAARGTFPGRWEGLQVVPTSKASPAARVAYQQRKLDLLLEWLDMLSRQASEFDHYTKRGLRVRIVRQEDGHRCPACESFNAHEVRRGSDTMPPLHPGCRCVLVAATTAPRSGRTRR